MKKRVKKTKSHKVFDNDVSSVDEIPSIPTSLNDASECIESVEVIEAEDKTGAEIGEVVYYNKVAEAAVTDEKPADTTIAVISEKAAENTVSAAVSMRSDSIVYLAAAACDDVLDRFRHTVYESIEVRKYIQNIGNEIYEFSVNTDDLLESFRIEVIEIVSAMVLFGDFVSHRIHQALMRVTGLRKTHGTFAADHKSEHRNQRMSDNIFEGQFAYLIESIIEKRNSLENKMDMLSSKKFNAVKKIERKIDVLAGRLIAKRKHCYMGTATALACMMLFCVTVNAGTVYNYSYHGTELGTVKSTDEIETAVTQVKEIIPESRNVEVDVNADPGVDITFEKEFNLSVALGAEELDSADVVADKISNCEELEGSGFAIKINGAPAVLVDTQETAEKILDEIKSGYCTIDSNGDIIASAVIQNDIQETESEAVYETEIENAEELAIETGTNVKADAADETEAEALIKTETETESNVAVNIETETITEINAEISEVDAETLAAEKAYAAEIRNMILAEIVNQRTGVATEAAVTVANENYVVDAEDGSESMDYSEIDFSVINTSLLSGISIDNIKFVEEVTIEPVTAKVSLFNDYDNAVGIFIDENNNSKLLTINTSEIEVYDEEIPYGITYEESADIYEGETEVKSEGTPGVKQIIAGVIKENGNEVSREIIGEIIITEPVDSVVLKGTKEKPSWAPSGSFITPARGTFTSGFGPRWGRNHNGWDIAGSHGSAIVASDGGTVVYSQYHNNGFGNLVKISHGNGVETWYAHNSQLLVSVGDQVHKGQTIAKMGSTGRSTGTHCHFEVRVNGNPVNPAQYLSR